MGIRPRECGSLSTPQWFVIQTHRNAEPLAAHKIGQQGFDVYYPIVWREPRYIDPSATRRRHRPAMQGKMVAAYPSYIFVQFSTTRDQWRPLCSTPGVRILFSSAPESPTPVPQAAFDAMKARIDREAEPVHLDTLDAINDGAIVALTGGAFGGHSAICTRGEERGGYVRVMLLKWDKEVEVRREHLEAV